MAFMVCLQSHVEHAGVGLTTKCCWAAGLTFKAATSPISPSLGQNLASMEVQPILTFEEMPPHHPRPSLQCARPSNRPSQPVRLRLCCLEAA